MTQIQDALVELNPWWRGELALDFKHRDVLNRVRKFIPLRQAIAFTGLRRVGKTSLLKKIAQEEMHHGLEAESIMYFSFDEFRQNSLREVLGEYERTVETDLRSGKHLLLLDEVQKMRDWANQVKAVYDAFPNVKIIVSGSESLFIRRDSAETLAGRLFEFSVHPLTFREFLGFKGKEFEPVGAYGKELEKQFDEYALSQGMPELAGIRDHDVIRKYVQESIVEKVVFRDLPELLGIRDVSTLQSLLEIIMEQPGQLLELDGLSRDLHTSRQTISTYVGYLERAFLVRKLYNYSLNRRKTERKLKKYYPTLVSPGLVFKQDDYSKSMVLEWLAVRELEAEFFWRDAYQHEVDIVLPFTKPVPIEVKYGKIDSSGIAAFISKFKSRKGYFVTANKETTVSVGKSSVAALPAYKLFLEKERTTNAAQSGSPSGS